MQNQSIEMQPDGGPAAHAWAQSLLKAIEQQEARFQTAKRRWNFWYYTSMYGSVVLSAIAALLLKWDGGTNTPDNSNLAALSATLAAILGTASSAGSFERRWSAARRAKLGMQKLKVDLSSPKADNHAIAENYKRVLEEYEGSVVGNDT